MPATTYNAIVMICDAHVHFFSPAFFRTLAAQRQVSVPDALARLGWDDPESPEALGERWLAELDTHRVARAALIASIPGDEDSVAVAAAAHPTRLIGYFMLDPTADDAENRVVRALERGMRGVCLFPAMQRYSLRDERVVHIAEILASFARPCALFVHCGVLSVGVRIRLGLPSLFDISRGNPLDLQPLAQRFPTLPIVIPHFGAGMFRETLMLADVCPNVHVDTSSSNRWMGYTPGLTLEKVFEAAIAVMGPERLLFGTDSSFFPRGWHRAVFDRQTEALQAIGATAEQISLIVGRNFERMLGLHP